MRESLGPARFARQWAESAWLFRSLTENLDQCVYVLDEHGCCLAANDAFCRWLKRPRAEILGRPVADFWPHPAAGRQADEHERVLRGEWIETEEEWPRAGQTSLVRMRKAPLRDAEGNVRGVLCLFREAPVDAGAGFPVSLPAASVHPELIVAPSPQSLVSRTILLVEPDSDILLLATTILTQQGFRVLAGKNGRQAVELYRQKQGEIDLVIVEENLRGQSGLEVTNELLALNPRLPIVLLNAAGTPAASWSACTSSLALLNKPYTPEQLVQCVRAALSRG